MDMKLFISK